MVTPPQQFCVRWNSYQSNLQNAFPKLLNSEHFVDVTLACENEMLKCHKVVLSACSTYFEKLLLDNPCQHPIIFMKDMKFQEMQSLVDFMYKGEVNVTQDDLPSMLRSAEALQIRGLCGSDQLLSQQQFGALKPQVAKPVLNSTNVENKNHTEMAKPADVNVKKEEKLESSESGNNPSSSECDSNDGVQNKEEHEIKEEVGDNDSYYEGESDLMDTEFLEEDVAINTNDLNKTPEFAIANVSCQYDGSPGSATNRRIRRSDEELRRAAECITRGQTFQTVSDQFNIPISTIRFYMARKGILPRRKRGRACSGPTGLPMPIQTYNSPGNTSPVGPPYHIVHYKLPALGVSKLK
ncbi:abrupt [Asbolus verrucosus]|uniref:Abrupt n=1 Tax=Asbolus verrucosus TaxID=1661398 RepID=A0A482VDV4_ASBVE|nr:abrupt [Asbolus verrucosus]